MSLNDKNLAYDLSIFEEVVPKKRKKDNILNLPQKNIKRRNIARQNQARATLIMALAVTIMAGLLVTFMLVNNNIKLTELTYKIQTIDKKLQESESLCTQMKVKSEAKFSLSEVEKVAKEELNMRKTDTSQVEYINLSKGDKSRKLQ
ncbi:MAG: hypothetical protein IJ758_04375 [Clostridia bacterium]|nr:hypothetical protein [Clostridia bacterium]